MTTVEPHIETDPDEDLDPCAPGIDAEELIYRMENRDDYDAPLSIDGIELVCPTRGHGNLEAVETASGRAIELRCPVDSEDGVKPCGDSMRSLIRQLSSKTHMEFVRRPLITIDLPRSQMTRRATSALASTDPAEPPIYSAGDQLVKVDAEGITREANPAQIEIELSEAARWYDPNARRAVDPPPTFAAFLARVGEYPDVPRLERVITTPVLDVDGELVTQPGYHRDARTLLVPSIGQVKVPDAPTADEVSEARQLLLDLVGDFPFVSDGDRAATLALLLLPFVRSMIDGPTPLHLATAPVQGTGKGKLIDTALAPGCGVVSSTPWTADEHEVRKTISSALRQGRVSIKWDNIAGSMASQSLALALTERVWDARVLGVSEMFVAPIHTIWAATANNAQLDRDLTRRTLMITLDHKVERPEDLSGPPGTGRGWQFDLPSHAVRNREQYVAAALTLARSWVVAGRPDPSADTPAFGSYEDYRRVIGGILEHAEIDGFLTNLHDARAAASDEVGPEVEVFNLISTLGAVDVTTAKPARLLAELDSDLLAASGTTSHTGFGKWLGHRRNRIVNGRALRQARTRSSNVWYVEALDTAE